MANVGNIRWSYLSKMAVDGYVVQLDLTDVREMVRLLGNATNNLNQLTRRVNSGGNIYNADLDDLQGKLDKLWGQANSIIRQLARL